MIYLHISCMQCVDDVYVIADKAPVSTLATSVELLRHTKLMNHFGEKNTLFIFPQSFKRLQYMFTKKIN